MPIYEYECAGCGQVAERWQKISGAPLTTCPFCGGSLHKLISSCSFSLKGSGWYVTDYAGKNPVGPGGRVLQREWFAGPRARRRPKSAKEAKPEASAPAKKFK